MPTCLLGLGSNLGDREAALRAALAAIDALPDVRLRKQSEYHLTQPIGGPAGQGEFLNAAAVVETSVAPLRLLDELKQIESRLGRRPAERWAPRTLDIDILLYDDEVAETTMLTLPHPRMSFRRFVLAPAAQIAPRMLHPIIGWPVERLLLHLDKASDQAVIVSPSDGLRSQIVHILVHRFGAALIDAPTFATAEQLWPVVISTWIAFPHTTADSTPAPRQPGTLPYAAAAFPKLTILVDADATSAGVAKSQWSAIVRRPGRGPTLRLQTTGQQTMDAEVTAALESVWPDLGPKTADRLE
jgi:2-amino-4-hydroxy-6-hydroxymethyldihydropteridine diphosphokinase